MFFNDQEIQNNPKKKINSFVFKDETKEKLTIVDNARRDAGATKQSHMPLHMGDSEVQQRLKEMQKTAYRRSLSEGSNGNERWFCQDSAGLQDLAGIHNLDLDQSIREMLTTNSGD